ncbi:MAG: CD225/dispanin family protein [Armatimonadetes bacterium]|nr:CD225/dispanin family protein [Armatimonadota bacterium]
MSMYYVWGSGGERYGPANEDLLTEWASQGRISLSSMVEVVETGDRMLVSSVPGFIPSAVVSHAWQPPATPAPASYPRAYGTVNNHLVKSILSIFFGVHILGIIATIFAVQVDGHVRRGDYVSAETASRRANLLANISIGIFVAMVVCGILFVIVGVATGQMH